MPHGPIVTAKYYSGRSDHLIAEIKDSAFSRGMYLFDDPNAQAITGWYSNVLGGSSHFSLGSLSVTVDTNLVPAIAASGTASGNIIGATVKTLAK